jgi:hypothetical protein
MAIDAFSLAEILKFKRTIIIVNLIGFILLRVSKGVEGKEYSFSKYLNN